VRFGALNDVEPIQAAISVNGRQAFDYQSDVRSTPIVSGPVPPLVVRLNLAVAARGSTAWRT
jgi:hypothetical protein